jgi:hypothetical protein
MSITTDNFATRFPRKKIVFLLLVIATAEVVQTVKLFSTEVAQIVSYISPAFNYLLELLPC